jgi:hypothetical protein
LPWLKTIENQAAQTLITGRKCPMAVENDIVLIYLEEKPLAFARIEEILPDHKPHWYHVKLLFLQVPLHLVTWILRDVYINGEPYTMDGKSIRLELVEAPETLEDSDYPESTESAPDTEKIKPKSPKGGKVISLADMKKK